MSGSQGSNQCKGNNTSADSEHIAKPIRDLVARIGHTLTIRQESTTDENKQYAEEKADRAAQLTTARHLNYISIFSGLIAFLALIFVCLQYGQNREVFKAGQRAWLIVVKTPIIPLGQHPPNLAEVISSPIESDIPFSVPIIFKNTGLSPALRVHMSQEAKLSGADCLTSNPASPYDSLTIVAPGEIATNTNAIGNFTNKCVSALNGGIATYTVHGTIFYYDIFTDPHETHYCVRYEGLTTRNMSACENGNDAK